MKNEEIVDIVEKFDNNNSPNLTFLNVGKRKNRFKGYKLVADGNTIGKICKSYLKSALDFLKSRDVEDYDFEGNHNDSILSIDMHLVDTANVEEVINGKDDLVKVIGKDTDFKVLNYISIRFRYKKDFLTIYSKYRQPDTKFRKSFKIGYMNDKMKELNSDIIYFDGIAEVIELKDRYYIVNENTLRTLFDYKEGIKKFINDNADMINNCEFLTNSSQFINDCINDGRYNGRLCKAILTNGFDYVHKAKDHLDTYFDSFGIDLKLSEDNEIVYNGKDDINEILRILLRHYAFDGLNGDKLVVKSVEEVLA